MSRFNILMAMRTVYGHCFLAVGYIKAENVVHKGESTWCDMSVTNREVMGMFRYEILAMFENGNAVYNDFTKALFSHRMEDLNDILQILHTLP